MSKLNPTELFYQRRNTALNLDPDDIGVHPSKDLKKVYGVLMEIGHPDGVATLVVLADGSVSMYYEMGGGIIGAGKQFEVAQHAMDFLKTVEQHLDVFNEAHVGMLPEYGHVLFYILTYKQGILTADAKEDALGEKRHDLSKVFFSGHGVISELQKVDEWNNAED